MSVKLDNYNLSEYVIVLTGATDGNYFFLKIHISCLDKNIIFLANFFEGGHHLNEVFLHHVKNRMIL